MKRILMMAGFGLLMVSPSFAAEYEAEFKEAFMKECQTEVSNKDCGCILSDLQTKITQDKLTDLYHKAASGDEVKYKEISDIVKASKQKCNVK